jgi:hypothetical protein
MNAAKRFPYSKTRIDLLGEGRSKELARVICGAATGQQRWELGTCHEAAKISGFKMEES